MAVQIINNLFAIFLVVTVTIILITWLMSINSALKLHKALKTGKANEANCGEYYLEGESARNLIYETYVNEIKNKVFKPLHDTMFWMVFIIIIIMTAYSIYNMVVTTNYSFKSGIIIAAYLALFSFTLASLIMSSRNIGDVVKTSLSAFTNDSDNIIKKQIGYLISVLVVIIGSSILYIQSDKFKEKTEPILFTENVALWISGSIIILAIFIPVLSSDIVRFNKDIVTYYQDNTVDGIKSINNDLVKEINNKNISLENNLRINYQSLNNTNELPIIDADMKKELYKYVLHGVNMAEIRNIVIPETLQNNINSKYLRGENIIVLKNDLLAYYNAKSNKSRLYKYFKDNNGKYINSLTDKKVDELLVKYVNNNDTYKMSNVVPVTIRDKLQKLRVDTIMEDTASNYYKKIGTISILLFIIGFYLIFHRIYERTDLFRQAIALIMVIIMLIVGLTGWFFKELWL